MFCVSGRNDQHLIFPGIALSSIKCSDPDWASLTSWKNLEDGGLVKRGLGFVQCGSRQELAE